jgi:protein ImuB
MLEQLCARLAARALATNELKLRLELEASTEDLVIGRSGDRVIENPAQITGSPDHQITRCLRLPVPMLDAKVFLKLLQLDLQAHSPPAPVTKVWLRAEPAEPRKTQNGLFVPEAPEAEKLSVTLARIERVVGKSVVEGQWPMAKERVGSPEIVDTHRGDGWRMKAFAASSQENRQSAIGNRKWGEGKQDSTREGACATTAMVALRVFRPALAAVVTVREGKPAQVASAERPTMRGEVVWCAGPWRLSGEWWTEQAWSRQEWDVAVRNEEGVALYRIYRDEIKGKWFVEGSYD